jgi:branched-chain amino acid aminotransferase
MKLFKKNSSNFCKYNPKTFHHKDLQYFVKKERLIPNFEGVDLIFGRINTDHMLKVDYFKTHGWDIPKIIPFQNLSIHPFNSTLHYAFSCFEGMKVYRDERNNIRLFRPMKNMERFLSSCTRLTLPEFAPKELLNCIKSYCKVEQNWVPSQSKGSLYLRPLGYSTANYLGVNKPDNCTILVMASPVGSYFDNKQIKLIVDESYMRGHPKNAAAYKLAANYGPSVNIQSRQEEDGFLQTIWTHDNYLIESGASNLFFVLKKNNGLEVVTHPLDGTILPGITRDSIIHLTPDKFPFKVSQRNFSIDEFIQRFQKGELINVFMSGTAAVISQVDMIRLRGVDYWFHNDKDNLEYSETIKKYILDIQHGSIEHPFSEVIE